MSIPKEAAMPVDKSYIGRTGAPVTMHVERGKIREFARAIKDDDPMYFDEAHATREAADGRGCPHPCGGR